MNYGKGVLLARTKAGLSQRKLAAQSKLSPGYIALIEIGQRKPTEAALDSIAKALAIPPLLLTLLSADGEDLTGLAVEQKAVLGERLLELLESVRESK